MEPAMSDPVAEAICRQLRKAQDGLSADHLDKLLESTHPLKIRSALEMLEKEDAIIRAQSGWYYLLEEPVWEESPLLPDSDPSIEPIFPSHPPVILIPQPTKNETTVMTPHLSVTEKLRHWFLTSKSARPIPVAQLAQELQTNNNTLCRSVSRLRKEWVDSGHEERANALDAAVIRRKCKIPMLEAPSLEDVTPSLDVIEEPTTTLADDAPPVEPEWVQDLLRLRPLSPVDAQQWQETATHLERALGLIGIAESHRSRTDLRAMAEWFESHQQKAENNDG